MDEQRSRGASLGRSRMPDRRRSVTPSTLLLCVLAVALVVMAIALFGRDALQQ